MREAEKTLLRVLLIVSLILTLITAVSAQTPTTGKVKVLVIPVEFPDLPGEGNPVDYSTIAERLREYWSEVSYGLLEINIEIHNNWITLDKEYSYYGRDYLGSEPHQCDFLYNVVQAADPEINYREYDFYIIMHSGHDQASSHNSVDMWSKVLYCGPIETDEKTLDNFVAIVSYDDPLGVWAHEFGHLLGLPDLYNVEKKNEPDDYVGFWDLMADGSWNGPPSEPGKYPAELTSWCRIKLGWLGEEDVKEVEYGDSGIFTLNTLEDMQGLRAIKIKVDELHYHLIEAREKTGYDSYLPGQGVLILWIDETRSSGHGIVKVIRVGGRNLIEAALSPGEEFRVENKKIEVDILEHTENGYIIKISYGAPHYILRVILPAFSRFYINGTKYETNRDGVLELKLPRGTYILEAETVIEDGGTRYIFESWSNGERGNKTVISLDRDETLKAIYSREYFVQVSTRYGNVTGGGWYREGEEAILTYLGDRIIEGEEGVRYVFNGWKGDINSTEDTLRFVVDRPLHLETSWKKQYRVLVSFLPRETEEKWIDEGERIKLEAPADILLDNGTKLVFSGWTGLNSSKREIEVRIDEPKNITATWKRFYKVEISGLPGYEGERWIEENTELNLTAPPLVNLSETERLKFIGWRGDIKSNQNTLLLKISKPLKIEASWIKEYRVRFSAVTLGGVKLRPQPEEIILEKDGRRVEVVGGEAWIEGGTWRILSVTWRGIEVGVPAEIEAEAGEIEIETNTERMRVTVLDIFGNPLIAEAEILGEENRVIDSASGSTLTLFFPAGSKPKLRIHRGLVEAVLKSVPGEEVRVFLPIILLTDSIQMTLGQIIFLGLVLIFIEALIYLKRFT